MFSLICVWINDWVNNREAGDLRRYRTHYDVMVMIILSFKHTIQSESYADIDSKYAHGFVILLFTLFNLHFH